MQELRELRPRYVSANRFLWTDYGRILAKPWNFAAGTQQQLAAVQGEPSPVEFAKKTIGYAKAKVFYITRLA